MRSTQTGACELTSGSARKSPKVEASFSGVIKGSGRSLCQTAPLGGAGACIAW